MPKYPEVVVNTTNAKRGLIATARNNLCRYGVSKAEQREFVQEATADGADVWEVVSSWVTIVGPRI